MLEKVHHLICWLAKCLIDACGITLLLMFFFWPSEPYTTKDISLVVSAVYLFLLIVSGLAWLSRSAFRTLSEIEEEKQRCPSMNMAVHEAGHAVICQKLHIPIEYIHIDEQHNYVRATTSCTCAEDIHDVLLILYAGAAAEEICCKERIPGDHSSSTSDFKRANEYLKEYIVMTDDTVSKTYLDAELADKMITYSKQFYEECKEILLGNETLLHSLSIRLYEKGSMSKKQVEEFFKEKKETASNS